MPIYAAVWRVAYIWLTCSRRAMPHIFACICTRWSTHNPCKRFIVCNLCGVAAVGGRHCDGVSVLYGVKIMLHHHFFYFFFFCGVRRKGRTETCCATKARCMDRHELMSCTTSQQQQKNRTQMRAKFSIFSTIRFGVRTIKRMVTSGVHTYIVYYAG